MKKNIIAILLFLLCAGANPATIYASEDGRLFDSIDSIEENFEDEILLDEFLDSTSFDRNTTRSITPIEDILAIINLVDGLDIIDQDLYLRTNPFVVRNIIDYPLWEMHSCQEPEKWIVGGHLFWNYMQRNVFTCKSTNISSYIDFEKSTLFEKLDTLSNAVKNQEQEAGLVEEALDIAKFKENLDLFKNFTAEQRRVGIMFHAWRQWQRAEIRMLWPFYYFERNLFATPSETRAIENEFGVFTPDEYKAFRKNHGISDKVGFGDFRFEANYVAYDSDTFAFRVGGFLTLPIAFAISTGIEGSSFNDTCQPNFSLKEVFDVVFKDGDLTNPSVSPAEQEALRLLLIGDICKNKNGFLLGTLDRLNAMLVETDLGNKRHLGLGFIIRSRTSLRALLDEFEWADKISWNNRLSVEYLMPADETRYYARRIPSSEFAKLDLETTDPEEQKEILSFIDQAIVDKFYPRAVKTRVHPGAQFRWFSRWCFNGDVWDMTIGSDFWLQRDESLKNLKCVDSTILSQLDVKNAKKGMAYQFKTVGSLGLKILRPDYAFFFNINAEGTSWNKGIGDDWAVSLNLEANF